MADTGKIVSLIKALSPKIDPETIESSVSDWLDDHPEATTTVEDGSITKAKLDSSLQGTVDDVSALKSANNSKSASVLQTVSGTKAVPVYTNKLDNDAIKSLRLSGEATSGCNMMFVLDGSSDEGWSKGSSNDYGLTHYSWYFSPTLGLMKNAFGFSSYLVNAGTTSFANSTEESFTIFGSGSNIGLRFKTSEIGSVDALREYLSKNPLTVWGQTSSGYDATAPQYYVAEAVMHDDYKCVGTTETINPLASGDSIDFATGVVDRSGTKTMVSLSEKLTSGVGNACIAVPAGALDVVYAVGADALADKNAVSNDASVYLIDNLADYRPVVGSCAAGDNYVYAKPAVFEHTLFTDYFPATVNDIIHIYATIPTASSSVFIRVLFYDASKAVVGHWDKGSSTTTIIDEELRPYGDCHYARLIWATNFFTSFSATISKNFLTRINFLETYHNYNENVISIAHRGGAWSKAPENTLEAFKWARENGYTHVETDIALTQDGEAVLLHDRSINRTARNADGTELGSTINIDDIDYDDVLDYDFGIYLGEQWAGVKIPKLEDFLKLCRNIGLYPWLELKASPGYTEAEVQSFVDMVEANGLIDHCVFLSSSETYLGYVKSYNANVRLMLGSQSGDITDALVEKALALKTDTNEVYLSASYINLTSTGIGKAQAAHIPIMGVNDVNAAYIRASDPYIKSFCVEDGLKADKILYEYHMKN